MCSSDLLAAARVEYRDIPVYRTVYQHPDAPELRKELEAGRFDYVIFTSASTVKGLVSAMGQETDFSHVTGLCIGSQTAAEAEKYGISVKIAEKASIDALVDLAVRADEKV